MFCLSYCQNLGHKCPLGPPGSAGSENWGLTSQVMTDPGYKIGSMSGLFPHFQFVCLVVHSQLKPSKCPYLAPSLLLPPRKLPISMSHAVSLILHFYAAHNCEQPHKSVIVTALTGSVKRLAIQSIVMQSLAFILQ